MLPASIRSQPAAANRDERAFEQPAELDLARSKPGRHLGFGSGVHHCVGAPLARRELYWAFRALVDRVESLRFAPGANSFEVAPNFALRALKALNLEFDPIPQARRIAAADVDAASDATSER